MEEPKAEIAKKMITTSAAPKCEPSIEGKCFEKIEPTKPLEEQEEIEEEVPTVVEEEVHVEVSKEIDAGVVEEEFEAEVIEVASPRGMGGSNPSTYVQTPPEFSANSLKSVFINRGVSYVCLLYLLTAHQQRKIVRTLTLFGLAMLLSDRQTESRP